MAIAARGSALALVSAVGALLLLNSCSLAQVFGGTNCNSSTSSVVPLAIEGLRSPATASAGANVPIVVTYVSSYENGIYNEQAAPGTLEATVDASTGTVVFSGTADLTSSATGSDCLIAGGISEDLASATVPVLLPAGTFTLKAATGSLTGPYWLYPSTLSATVSVLP